MVATLLHRVVFFCVFIFFWQRLSHAQYVRLLPTVQRVAVLTVTSSSNSGGGSSSSDDDQHTSKCEKKKQNGKAAGEGCAEFAIRFKKCVGLERSKVRVRERERVRRGKRSCKHTRLRFLIDSPLSRYFFLSLSLSNCRFEAFVKACDAAVMP